MKKEIVKDRVIQLEHFIDKNLRIEDLIKQKQLGTISGRTMACPFHDDISPSMFVDVKENKFYCHSCRRGGRYAKLYEYWATVIDNRKINYYEILEEILKADPIRAYHVGFYSIFKSRAELLDIKTLDIKLNDRRKLKVPQEHELPIKFKIKKHLTDYEKGSISVENLLDMFAQVQKGGKATVTNKKLDNNNSKPITLDELLDTML